MSKRDEFYSEQFQRWEERGRGWKLHPHPVELEPAFVPFKGYIEPPRARQPVDDGRRHTAISGFFARLQQQVAPPPKVQEPEPETEPEPNARRPEEWIELQLSLPLSRTVPTPQVETFIRHVARPGEPLTLEILGTEREIVPQWVTSPRAATRVKSAIGSCFPGIICAPLDSSDEFGGVLGQAWSESSSHFAVIELGLGRECMLPLGSPRCDLLATLAAAMAALENGELALFQVMFEPVQAPWAGSMVRAVTDAAGKPFFTDRADLVRGATLKSDSPLFTVGIRLASSAADTRRTWEIIADMAAALSALARPECNYFVPLGNGDYPVVEHEADILNRQSRRCGMLLSMEELIALITPPTTATTPKLRRETKRTHPAPDIVCDGTLSLGTNAHAGVVREVLLSPEHRVRHTHIIGGTGSGKSNMLLNLITQDIAHGEGLAVLDPHGDLIDMVLARIPPERVGDVILLDPSDEDFPIGFNILAAHSDSERSLLASDLVSVFRRLSTSWGDQMESVLRNAILAFLKSSRGGTLMDLSRFLTDAEWRKDFLTTVSDPLIVHYWQRTFPLLTGGKSIGPILTRLDEFLSRELIRNMVAQDANRLDFSEILDRGRILLVRLPGGLIGDENTALFGSLVMAKLQMAAMSRQRLPAAQRRDFWCYLDEAHHFMTASMAEILTGARKYRLGLALVHQYLWQMDANPVVKGAVMSSCCTRIVFNVGNADARTLESEFAHFQSGDLINLAIGEAVCRVERSEFDFNLRVPNSETVDEDLATELRESVIAASRAQYARPRSEVEAELSRKWHTESLASKTKPEPSSRPATEPPKVAVTEPASEKPTDSEKESAPRVEAGSAQENEDLSIPVISETVSVEAPQSAVEPGGQEPANPATVPPVEGMSENPKSLPEFGRGGTEHRAIQQDIKECAEKFGFHVVIEKTVLGGAGFVDVSLERENQKIACEISVTRPAEEETGNLRKCLAAGYEAVIAVASQKDHLIDLARAIQTKLSAEDAKRIHVCLPSRFSSILKRLIRDIKVSESNTARSGSYKIRRKYSEHAQDEQALGAEEEFLRAVGRALRGE